MLVNWLSFHFTFTETTTMVQRKFHSTQSNKVTVDSVVNCSSQDSLYTRHEQRDKESSFSHFSPAGLLDRVLQVSMSKLFDCWCSRERHSLSINCHKRHEWPLSLLFLCQLAIHAAIYIIQTVWKILFARDYKIPIHVWGWLLPVNRSDWCFNLTARQLSWHYTWRAVFITTSEAFNWTRR